jgi:hypothetical protein
VKVALDVDLVGDQIQVHVDKARILGIISVRGKAAAGIEESLQEAGLPATRPKRLIVQVPLQAVADKLPLSKTHRLIVRTGALDPGALRLDFDWKAKDSA